MRDLLPPGANPNTLHICPSFGRGRGGGEGGSMGIKLLYIEIPVIELKTLCILYFLNI